MRATVLALVTSLVSLTAAARADEPTLIYAQAYEPQYAPYLPFQQSPELRYEERSRPGLLAAGLAIFGGVWSINALVAFEAQDVTLAIPVVGPLFEIARQSKQASLDCARDGWCPDNRPMYVSLVIDATVQAAGIIMAGAGLFSKRKVAVFEMGPRLTSLVPTVNPNGGGLAATGTF